MEMGELTRPCTDGGEDAQYPRPRVCIVWSGRVYGSL
ncbi:hypothetical protein NFI96_030181 [Prochilodus magdalenae]|nr:hypothetical protein NFI96_030181 [Prochilodus magdalenae]